MKASLLFVVIGLFLACSGPAPKERSEWSSLPNAHARHFKVQVRGADRRILVFGPGGETDTAGIYNLRGTAGTHELQIDTPLTRVAVVSTTHLPYFAALRTTEAVVGVAHSDKLRDPVFRDRVEKGLIAEIARADGLDRERLIALAPQALFDHPFGQSARRVDVVKDRITVTEYLEQHPLGRAEWIRFFGILMGEQERADSIFAAIAHRYITVRGMRSALGAGPMVFFGSHWEKDWHAPPGNSYMATLIADAGGRYWFADSSAEGNIAVPLERLLRIGSNCDRFGVITAVDGSMSPMLLASGDTRIAGLDAVRKGGFFGSSGRSDLFGQALLEPEVILKDLRCIFHPRTCRGYQPKYFMPLPQ